jgi:4-aminobutyrate aminotransferase-like enzyme
MNPAIQHAHETRSNEARCLIEKTEPLTLRTYTPTKAVLARSAGIYHWTPEGRRLYDFTSGVLVANLGHNPSGWFRSLTEYMQWPKADAMGSGDYFEAQPLTAYNAITTVETEASRRLIDLLQKRPGGNRMEQVLWAASGSEAIQKALWAALARDRSRDMIIATRYGFHGKKGLAGAVTGSESDRERDPRVRFITFPMSECSDVSLRDRSFDPLPYARELEALKREFGKRLGCLITEPYLGGGGSYHPPKDYLHLLQSFCRGNDLVLILDEVQSNFGRTARLFAYESYGLEPDIVVLGKGLANGVPVAAAVGRRDVFASLEFGEGSDTWSANPLACAAVLATLDAYAKRELVAHVHRVSPIVEQGLVRLKEFPFVEAVRGERDGMVWGLAMRDHGGRSAADWANAVVLGCYLGESAGGDGIHLLGPLAKKVIRIAPPLVITEDEAKTAMTLMMRCCARLTDNPSARH